MSKRAHALGRRGGSGSKNIVSVRDVMGNNFFEIAVYRLCAPTDVGISVLSICMSIGHHMPASPSFVVVG